MILKSLKLQNYRRFESLDLEFPENLIGIIGRNGAGKSTIVEAIGWVLYGNRFVRSDKMDVRSQHAPEKSLCSAEMVFVYGGAEYRIERKLKGANALSEAAIWRDGENEPVAVQDRGVNEFVEALLQLDYRSFTTSVFAQQRELAKLSTLQPEQRRQAINRLINIDQIDRAREAVRQDRNDKKAFVNGKKSTQKDVEALKQRQKELATEAAAKLSSKDAQQAAVDELAQALQKLRQDFEAVNKLRDSFQKWEKQLATLQSRLGEKEKNLARSRADLAEIDKTEKELQKLAEPLAEFELVKADKDRLDHERDKFTALKSRTMEKQLVENALAREEKNRGEALTKSHNLDELSARFGESSAQLTGVEEKLAEVLERIKIAHGQKTMAEKNGTELKQKLARVRDLGPDGQCPVCSQRMGDHFSDVVRDFEEQLARLREEFAQHRDAENAALVEQKEKQAELSHLRAERDELLKQLKTTQDAQQLVEKIAKQIADYQIQLEQISAAITAIGAVEYDEAEHKRLKARHDELAAVQQKVARLEERVARRGSVAEFLASTERDLAAIQADMESARAAQSELNFNEEEFIRARLAVEHKSTALDSAKSQLAQTAQEAALLARDIDNVKTEIDAQKKLQLDIKAAEEEIDYLNALEDYFGQFRLELAGRIRPLIARCASELLRQTTSARYSQIELDPDYNIKIFDGNAPFAIERFSGGEQDLTNLCLRIAISQVVAERSGGAPINFIVLDEIFGSQDMERRDLILNALGQLSSQFRQIFIITHIESIKDVLPVLVNVAAKDDERSTAEIV